MKTYQVYIQSEQTWTYVYQVEAKNAKEAEKIGLKKHDNGAQSENNWVDCEEFEVFQTIEGAL